MSEALVDPPVSDLAKSYMASLAIELRQWYTRRGQYLSLAEQKIDIERRWGDRILNEVCIPFRMNRGFCLIIAAQVACE